MTNNPLLISHRGDRINSIENTIDACDKALLSGANALEIDIRQTGSGEIVVFHDFSLKRMFNMNGYVGRTPLQILKQYPYITGQQKSENLFIETLDDFFEHFKDKIPINLDAKTVHFFDFKFADKIISTIKRHELIDSVWVSCFNPFLLQIIKLKEKRIRTGYLFQGFIRAHTFYDRFCWSDAWHPHYKVLNEWLAEKAHKLGKQLYTWTVNDQDSLEMVLQYSVDGIISDDIKGMKRLLKTS